MQTFTPIEVPPSGVPDAVPPLFSPPTTYVTTDASSAAPREARGRAPWFVVVLIAVAALLAGLLVGAGVIGRSQTADMRDQRDAAIVARDDARSEVDSLDVQVADLEEEADAATEKVTLCQEAAKGAHEMLAAYDDEWWDFTEYLDTEIGSQEEADIQAHLEEQNTVLVEQRDATESALDDCRD